MMLMKFVLMMLEGVSEKRSDRTATLVWGIRGLIYCFETPA
jgi:hypothetical protein